MQKTVNDRDRQYTPPLVATAPVKTLTIARVIEAEERVQDGSTETTKSMGFIARGIRRRSDLTMPSQRRRPWSLSQGQSIALIRLDSDLWQSNPANGGVNSLYRSLTSQCTEAPSSQNQPPSDTTIAATSPTW
jgi:hypothetical protein